MWRDAIVTRCRAHIWTSIQNTFFGRFCCCCFLFRSLRRSHVECFSISVYRNACCVGARSSLLLFLPRPLNDHRPAMAAWKSSMPVSIMLIVTTKFSKLNDARCSDAKESIHMIFWKSCTQFVGIKRVNEILEIQICSDDIFSFARTFDVGRFPSQSVAMCHSSFSYRSIRRQLNQSRKWGDDKNTNANIGAAAKRIRHFRSQRRWNVLVSLTLKY